SVVKCARRWRSAARDTCNWWSTTIGRSRWTKAPTSSTSASRICSRRTCRRSARAVKLGISTHDHAELERALALAPDYVALGPIYPTTLKAMPWAPQGLPRIGEWKRRIGARPLVAIGGITLERAAGCFDAGADSVAMVSDVTRHPDPTLRVTDWVDFAGARA